MPGDGKVTYPSETSQALIPYKVVTDTYDYFESRNYVNDINQQYTQVLTAYDENGKTRETYNYGNERLDYSDGTDIYYYGYTGTGSVAHLTNTGGNVETTYSYDVFGNTSVTGNENIKNPYTYNAEYTDASTGNQYLRARYYDPDEGTFLTQDSYLGSLLEPLSQNLYTYTENNPVNYTDPSGHGIWSKIKSGAKKIVKAVKTGYQEAKTWAKNTWNTAKTGAKNLWQDTKKTISNVVSGGGGSSGGGNRSGNSSSNRGYTSGSGGRGSGGGSYRTSSGGGNSRNYSRQLSTYEKAKSSGQSSYNWSGSKLKEADNIWNSWTKGMEKRVQHFCTTANRIKKDSAEFVKNIDWKKVGIGIGTTLVIAGVVVATGGAAGPIIAGAVIGGGSSAVISGVVTAKHGGSIADVAKSASNGVMWGAIGDSVGGVASSAAAPAITKAFGSGLKSTLATGGLTGAVGGGLTGGVMSGVSGNDAKTVLKDTMKSAAAGAAIGVASAGIGYGIKSLRSGGTTGTAGSGGEAGKSGTDSWDMIEGGGKINGREYSQHAMERMAPDTPQVRAELSRRAEEAATQRGFTTGTQEYYEYCKKYVDPRNIPPSVIEDVVSSTKGIPGNRPDTFIHETVDVKIVINSAGKVITVIPK